MNLLMLRSYVQISILTVSFGAILLGTASVGNAQSRRTTGPLPSRVDDPTVASPEISRRLRSNEPPGIQPAQTRANSQRSSGRSAFQLKGLVMTSPDSGVANLLTPDGVVAISLKREQTSQTLKLPSQQFHSSTTVPANSGSLSENLEKESSDIDLATSFSIGDELYRVVNFSRDAIVLEQVSRGRYFIVR